MHELNGGRILLLPPNAARIREAIPEHSTPPRILTFWSVGDAYPRGKLRYHLGQLGMLNLTNRLGDMSCEVDALICDSQSRNLLGTTVSELKGDIDTTTNFVAALSNSRKPPLRMSVEVRSSGYAQGTTDISDAVVRGALQFRNFVQLHPPPALVVQGLSRFRSFNPHIELDIETDAYLRKLKGEFPRADQLELAAALFASQRRPSWFEAFWLGEIAAWLSMQAKNQPNLMMLEANRSAYAWLTHKCFLAIGLEGGTTVDWPLMCFVSPILSSDGRGAMELSAERQAIFLHFDKAAVRERLGRANDASIKSMAAWFASEGHTQNSDCQDVVANELERARSTISSLLERSNKAHSAVTELPVDPRVGVCLSGGGFRATFFHLGTVKALMDAGLLTKVVGVYSVSGGSITAAILAKHWDALLNGDLTTFNKVANQLVALARKDIRGKVVRRLMLGQPTRRLASYYSKYAGLKGLELGHLPTKTEFVLLGTDVRKGGLVAFDRTGVQLEKERYECASLPLSQAVAASSAFPALFAPLAFTREALTGAKLDGSEVAELVTDGGVFDNLGIARFVEVANTRADAQWCNMAFISDASAPFEVSGQQTFRWINARTVRAFDILMKRVETLRERTDSDGFGIASTLYPIEARIDTIVHQKWARPKDRAKPAFKTQDADVQKKIATIRTDLNRFSDDEICALVRHGYEVALDALARSGSLQAEFKPSDPCGVEFPKIVREFGSPLHDDTNASVPIRRAGLKNSHLLKLMGPWEWTLVFIAVLSSLVVLCGVLTFLLKVFL